MKEDKKFIKEKSLDASSDSRTISLFLTIVRRLSSRLEPFSTTSRKWNDPFMIDIQQRSGQFLLCFASVTFSASHQSSKMSENNINHPYVHRKTRRNTKKKEKLIRTERASEMNGQNVSSFAYCQATQLPLQAKQRNERNAKQFVCQFFLLSRGRPCSYAGQCFHPFFQLSSEPTTRGSRKIQRYRRSGREEANPVVIRLKRSPILRLASVCRWAFSCVFVCRPKTIEVRQGRVALIKPTRSRWSNQLVNQLNIIGTPGPSPLFLPVWTMHNANFQHKTKPAKSHRLAVKLRATSPFSPIQKIALRLICDKLEFECRAGFN